MNKILNQYSKNLVGANQRDWADYVGRAEFSCNLATHLTINGFSFVVALERTHWTLDSYQDGKDVTKKREQILEINKLLVKKTQKCLEK